MIYAMGYSARLEKMMDRSDSSQEFDLVTMINALSISRLNEIQPIELRQCLIAPDYVGTWFSPNGLSVYGLSVLSLQPGKGIILDALGFAIWESEKAFDHEAQLLTFDKQYIPRNFNLIASDEPIRYALKKHENGFEGTYSRSSEQGLAFMKRNQPADELLSAVMARFYLDGLRKLQ
jgi:hypothetical protein